MAISPFWVIPFVLILLSIAIFPLISSHFWEKNLWWISIFVFTIPMGVVLVFFMGPEILKLTIEKAMDYISFILLLASLYVISGGIHISGSLNGSPTQNTIFMFTGSLMASLIGTTGASMLLIRPLIRANQKRKKVGHIVVFFIFLVSNIGGILTPLGDPPLFLGYLQGVPFEWTLNLFPHWAFAGGITLLVFYLYDSFVFRKEGPVLSEPAGENGFGIIERVKYEIDASLTGFNVDELLENRRVSASMLRRIQETMAYASDELERFLTDRAGLTGTVVQKEGFQFGGKLNFILLAGVVFSIYMQGYLSSRFPGVWPHFGPQEAALLLLLLVSLKITPVNSAIREENGFSFGPIKEVAFLFSAIFATMIPALYILEHEGAHLGIKSAWQFFWASGALSSFLDNAPTYLTFLSVGMGLDLPNNLGFTFINGGHVSREVLLAISAGSVFMGAMTYIGNGPNFMVRSIAESHGVKMPSFFGYMGYSLAILLPIYVLLTLVFFI